MGRLNEDYVLPDILSDQEHLDLKWLRVTEKRTSQVGSQCYAVFVRDAVSSDENKSRSPNVGPQADRTYSAVARIALYDSVLEFNNRYSQVQISFDYF